MKLRGWHFNFNLIPFAEKLLDKAKPVCIAQFYAEQASYAKKAAMQPVWMGIFFKIAFV
jgi:hypothetical protein